MSQLKTAIVTGASSGIGQEIAIFFSEKGWRVFLLSRSEEALDQLVQKLGPEAYSIPCDLACEASIQKAISQLLKKKISIDAIINNAGIFQPGSVVEDTDDLWLSHFQVNLMGPVRLTRGLWKQLQVQEKGGAIINISSTLAHRPIPNTGAYSALKAALSNWTQTLAIEGAPHNIRANVVSPGIVDTPIHSFHRPTTPEAKKAHKDTQGLQPLGRIGCPQDIAPLVYHLACSDSSWTTGVDIPVDGGILLNS